MNSKRLLSIARPHSAGISQIELLVSISILALFLAVSLPAVQAARDAAGKVECLSRIRDLNLAMQSYAVSHRGKLPALTGSFEIFTPRSLPDIGNRGEAPWTVALLPHIDQSTIYDQLITSEAGKNFAADEVHTIALKSIKTLQCPDSSNALGGGLSYVVNAGIIPADLLPSIELDSDHSAKLFDLGYNGYGGEKHTIKEQGQVTATGVFWRIPLVPTDRNATNPPMTGPVNYSLDLISSADGTSHTLLLAENMQARSYSPETRTGGWISTATGDIAFGVVVPVTRVEGVCEVALSDIPGGLGIVGGDASRSLSLSDTPVPPESLINSNRETAIEGRAPRPSSSHGPGVNVSFADGSAKFLSEEIDPSVYVRLLSPAGGRFGQFVLNESQF